MVAHFLNMEDRIIQRTTSGKSVREFFSERRQPPGAPWHSPSSGSDYNQARMAQHFRRTTGPNRNPSGRDRAKPLAPLNRTAPVQRSPQNSGRSGTKNTPPHSGRVLSQLPPRSPLNSARNLAPLPNVGQKSSNNNHQPTPPKENKPKYVRTMRRNSKGSPTEDRLPATPPKRVAKPGGAPRNGLRSDPRGADITSGIPAPDSGRKLSEFQQWQLEQQKAKEERLARFREGQTDRIQNHAKWEENNNTVNNVTNARKPGQLRTQIDRKPQPLAKQTRNGMQQTGRNKFQQNQRNNQHPRVSVKCFTNDIQMRAWGSFDGQDLYTPTAKSAIYTCHPRIRVMNFFIIMPADVLTHNVAVRQVPVQQSYIRFLHSFLG